MFLVALDFILGQTYEIVVVGNLRSKVTKIILQVIRTRFIPNKVILIKKENDTSLENLAEYTEGMKTIDGKTTVYVCKNFSCNYPTTDLKKVLTYLGERDDTKT